MVALLDFQVSIVPACDLLADKSVSSLIAIRSQPSMKIIIKYYNKYAAISFCLVLVLLKVACEQKSTNSNFTFSGRVEKLNPKHKLRRSNVEELPSFYQHIDEAAESAKVQPLNTVQLEKEDFELRIWTSPGAAYLFGLRLHKSNGQWERGWIEIEPIKFKSYRLRKLPDPQIKWEALWEKIEQEELMSLSLCKDLEGYIDGTAYIVEIVSQGEYKNFMYMAPDGKKCPAIKKVDRLTELISAN